LNYPTTATSRVDAAEERRPANGKPSLRRRPAVLIAAAFVLFSAGAGLQ